MPRSIAVACPARGQARPRSPSGATDQACGRGKLARPVGFATLRTQLVRDESRCRLWRATTCGRPSRRKV